MDPDTGTKLESSHIQAVMRSVAETFMPDPAQSTMIQPYSNRRFGGTLCSITKTPPTDIVAYGGWAGVPELAKVVTEASDILTAWKRSMPHLYSDRRSEDVEIQKALHMAMLRGLLVCLQQGADVEQPATWENVQQAAMAEGADGVPVLTSVRLEAMALVAKARVDLKVSPVYGTETQKRLQFQVNVIKGKRLPTGLNLKFARKACVLQKVEAPGTPVLEPGTVLAPPAKAEKAADAEPSAEAEEEVVEEWVLTMQSKYLHKVSVEGDELFTACKWRKGRRVQKPIPGKRIVWRSTRAEALAMRIGFCPARVCRP